MFPKHFSSDEVDFYRVNGYLPGPRVLDDVLLDQLRRRFDDILEGRIDFPAELLSGSPKDGVRRGNFNGVKIVNVFRHDPVFAHERPDKLIFSIYFRFSSRFRSIH